jgi:hypothetical protein
MVLEALEADVASDGAMHVQKRGTFNIEADTRICLESVVNPDFLQETVADCVREAGRNPIVIGVMQWGDNPGEQEPLLPYRLTFAAWQGDPEDGGAAWVGEISRTAWQLHPDAAKSADQTDSTSTRSQLLDYYSTGWDKFDLSKAFVLGLGQKPEQAGANASTASDADVADFEQFLTSKLVVTSRGSNERFEENGIWIATYLGADLTMISGTWRVSKNAEGWLELCRTVTESGFPPAKKKFPEPRIECSLVKPFYKANAFINLRIRAPSGPYLFYVVPQAEQSRR